jgi:hypothetical protein
MGKVKNLVLITLLLATAGASFGQEVSKSKISFYLDGPIITDSATTLMIPIAYDAGMFSSNKLAAWGTYYANLVFYNFKTDSSFRLFDHDTYIMNFKTYYYSKSGYGNHVNKRISKNWILYRVKNIDHNRNGKIDQHDPDMLYVSDIQGRNLQRLTGQDENVISIDIYYDQNFALIKLQKDSDKDGSYKSEDKEHCYVRLDLTTLRLGQRIEVK